MKIRDRSSHVKGEMSLNGEWWTPNQVFFFNWEKRHYNKKTISELRLQEESTAYNEKQTLVQIEAF